MRKFEHKVDVNTDIFSARIGGSIEAGYLKRWGDDGWELASALPVFNGQGTAYYWKREVVAPTKEVITISKQSRNFDFIKEGAKVWIQSIFLTPLEVDIIEVNTKGLEAKIKTSKQEGWLDFTNIYETVTECRQDQIVK